MVASLKKGFSANDEHNKFRWSASSAGCEPIKNLLWPLPEITSGEIDAETLVSLLGRTDPVILEIGCNDGAHTRWFLETFPGARVYSFEPDPEPGRDLLTTSMTIGPNSAKSRSPTATEPHGSMPAVDGRTVYDHEPNPQGLGLLGLDSQSRNSHLEMHPWCRFDDSFEVTTMRLDTWRQKRGLDHIDFIWADVQGAESDLIRGAAETLSKTRYFYTEYNDEELYEGQVGLRRLLRMLRKIGFELVTRYENDILLRNLHLPAL